MKTSPSRESTAYLGIDYIAASVDNSAESVVWYLRCLVPGLSLENARRNSRYDQTVNLMLGSERFCSLSHGRNYETVLIESSGQNARRCHRVLSDAGLPFSCSRLDAALDLLDPPMSFEDIAALAVDIAAELNITTDTRGDWLGPNAGIKGRTLYVGARTSPIFVRIYEKGKEQGISGSGWVRFEVEYKPNKAIDKRLASSLSPGTILSGSRVVTRVLEKMGFRLEDACLQRAPRIRRDSTRARRALARQYLPTITDWIEEAGSPDEFLADLFRVADELSPIITIGKNDDYQEIDRGNDRP